MKYGFVYMGYPLKWKQAGEQGFIGKLSFWLYQRLAYYFTIWSTRNVDKVIFISKYMGWHYFHYMPKWFMKHYHKLNKNPYENKVKQSVKDWG